MKKSKRRKMLADIKKWPSNNGTEMIVKLLIDAHERQDNYDQHMKEVRQFLAQHSQAGQYQAHRGGKIQMTWADFSSDENMFYEVPKPEQAEIVYSLIKKHVEEKVLALAPVFAELLGQAPSNWEINGLVEEILRNWDEDDEDYREICIRRSDLEELSGLHHQTLKKCTDHLQYRGYIHQIGRVGGTEKIVRYGLPTDRIVGLTGWLFEYCDDKWPDRPGYD